VAGWTVGIVVGAVCLTLAPSALAFPSSRLIYARGEGAGQCPDEPALRKAVVDRLGYDPFFPWADVTIVARVIPANGGFVGTVELVDKAGIVKGARELRASASQCGQLIASMALAISIAIDPDSLDRGGAPPIETRVEEAEPTEEFWKEESAPSVDDKRATQAPPPSGATARPPVRVEIAGQVAVASGFAPAVAIGPGLGVRLRYRAWSTSLEGRYLFAQDRDVTGGTLASSAADGTLSACGHAGPVFGCALGTAGALHVTGEGVDRPRSETAAMVRVGPRAGAEWRLSELFALQAHADLAFNLIRPDISLDGNLVWSAPLVAGLGAISLSGRFP
jgi:hypothetical protein